MRKIPKAFKYTFLTILFLFVIYVGWALWFALTFHGESFKDSEKYIIDLSLDSTIGRIKDYKSEHPKYRKHEVDTFNNVPYEYGYFSGLSNSATSTREPGAIWYTCCFYIEQSDATVGCCIDLRSSPTEILLIDVTSSDGINKGINDYKEISRKENRMIKKKFEEEILDKICNGKWRHKRWYE